MKLYYINKCSIYDIKLCIKIVVYSQGVYFSKIIAYE